MMNRNDITTSIVNILSQDRTKWEEYIKDNMNIMIARGQANLSSIQRHKAILGKQHYCVKYRLKNWVWELEDLRIYVNTEGASFEVLDKCNINQAWSAWKNYYNIMK